MNRVLVTLAVALALGPGAEGAHAQSGYDLFQQALVKERSNGQIQQAIELYQKIVAQYAADRALAARALVQLGRAYETLGSAEARKPYEQVIRDYAEQESEVALARARLAALGSPAAPAASNSGMQMRRIWVGPELDAFNGLTRDGRYLSYVDWPVGALAVLDLATGDRRHVTPPQANPTGYPLYSTFSPDGRWLAFTWDDPAEVRIVGADGSGLRTLYRNPALEAVYVVEWSPDGSQILTIVRNAATGLQIGLLAVADGSVRILKSLEWRYPTMGFSPDGRYLAYSVAVGERDPQSDVFLLATDGSREIPVVVHPANDEIAAWTPGGDGLLIHSDRSGTMGLWLAPLGNGMETGEPRLVQPNLSAAALAMGPSGALYYRLDRWLVDVYLAEFDPVAGRVIGAPARATGRFTGQNSGPEWSPDGSQLALRRRIPGGSVVVVRSELSGEERELSLGIPNLHYRGPRWSPDGRSMLMFGRDPRGRWGLYHVAIESGQAQPVLVDGHFVQQWQWTPDGRAAFIRDNAIKARDLATGHETVLQRVGLPLSGGGFEFSRDGRWLAYTTQDSATKTMSLNLMSASGGPSRELLRVAQPEELYSPAWTPDGRYVLFTREQSLGLRRAGRRSELWRVAVETGAAESLGVAMPGLLQVRVRPDGRRIAFTGMSGGMDELWVMENFLPPPGRPVGSR